MASSRVGSRIRLIESEMYVNPHCIHGPTLLFENINNNHKYYSCSSCRNRKDCDFYISFDDWLKTSDKLKTKYSKSFLNTNQKYFYDKCIKQLKKNQIKFCRNCSQIIINEKQLSEHKTHEIIDDLSAKQLKNPTKLMNSLTDNKFFAQYLFSNETKKFIINEIIKKNDFNSVICIGCPTIHEYIDCRKNKLNMKSILLDIDDRYKQFYSQKKFLKYNLFNNYFFDGIKDENSFVKFIRDSPKESIVLLMDPPFGGLVEAMAKTVEKISEIWRNEKEISNENKLIPILLFFPYFNEKRIITTIPLKMSDYMVDYENHNKFTSGTTSGRKFGSPVRIFTNIELSSIVLPQTLGYYYCDYCLKYVSKNNKHCFECNDCSARDGKPYRHCYECKRCVKNTWIHCKRCGFCHLSEQLCKRKSLLKTTDFIKKKRQ